MLGVVGSIKAGPILEYPLIEKNLQRDIRPIVTKVRKVRGKRGWFLRRLGRFFGGPRTPEGLGHHAIQVGDYAYELHTDEANQKYLIVQRLTGEQIWMSTVKHEVVGYTDLSDEDIQLTSIKVQSWMRSRERGRYHVRHNNCQHFTQELLQRILLPSDGTDSESASLSSGTTFCEKSSEKFFPYSDGILVTTEKITVCE
ncbi:hypothetical protein KC343_g1215 [Hortaea werneckii]|uniref:PPPDE domain-containing protein n=1 Tax=Hortaea werneckii TaxID=91943 RepID=A0A3M7GJH6_HORWE|nr:hypothetical protein KC323_g6937 [Hortaea werneckii]KAI6861773.1 hypothetical protein KC338_g6484 [Hortaea werneckii]KAI7351501.1 hypothetical protein KC320_g4896 [Hortaea werneckii]KAI7571932.1 hypothetical protein KC317_g1200 [Hortaea werneckii]KAI7624346.1 hypothetical protein KC346_g2256 [Hortaea werneckii]